MGYAVQGQCFEKEIDAQDLFFGGSVPVISADGRPMMFQRKPDGWYLQSEKVETHFPSCDPVQNFQDGAEIGFLILGMVVSTIILGRIARMFA
ncbi:hypothetical protein EGK75_10500 [Neisseria weixii]|uniref:Uncharacterized protein n=1 Tax=Neisseria weixii TaxID=1853276 RepID=A0A3N4MTX3_9NEIS|nr:hypothetical protein [Neisseria weixii]RPD83120.1 hypothetical protein EGK74_13460 [Neisseria weixii]RPD85610.1 hypothetical protein EGK75_10500 [Neisseria weixii]